jgi:hypothetical protein
MRKFLNRGISTPWAIVLILILATAVGVFTFWQYSEIKKEQDKIAEEISQNTNAKENQKEAKTGYVPESMLDSDDEILSYLAGLYCGLLRNDVSGDGVYKKTLVAGQPDFFVSICSVQGDCAGGTTMNIYSVDRETGLINTAWWSNVYVWAGSVFSPGGSSGVSDIKIYSKSKVNFEDLDGDGNFEIVQDITEMQCSNQCEKEGGCCWQEDYCTENNIIFREEYQKKFKWQDDKDKFVQFH